MVVKFSRKNTQNNEVGHIFCPTSQSIFMKTTIIQDFLMSILRQNCLFPRFSSLSFLMTFISSTISCIEDVIFLYSPFCFTHKFIQ